MQIEDIVESPFIPLSVILRAHAARRGDAIALADETTRLSWAELDTMLDRVAAALEKVDMSHRMKHYPSQLSGGQQQRVAVARALAGDPVTLLADEPTGNLDSKNGEAVMELLTSLHAEGSTIVMVTHNPEFFDYTQRVVHVIDGKIVSEDRHPM